MKTISKKSLYLAWTIASLFAISIILSLTISHWIFMATLCFAVWYVAIIFRLLHCPYCNKMESLINLTFAINHQYYCRNCGQKIIIEKERKP